MRFSSVITIADGGRGPGRAATTAAGLARAAGVPLTTLELPDRPVGAQLATRVNGRDGALLVIDARGGGLGGDRLDDVVAEGALQHVRQPVLVVGPHAHRAAPDTLVIPLDGAGLGPVAVPVVDRWARTFADCRVVVLVLEAPNPWPAMTGGPTGATDDGDVVVAQLAARGVTATLERVAAHDPGRAVADAAADQPGSVLAVVPTPRWPGTSHWHATCRRLIRKAPCPVLAVPADGAVGQPPSG